MLIDMFLITLANMRDVEEFDWSVKKLVVTADTFTSKL